MRSIYFILKISFLVLFVCSLVVAGPGAKHVNASKDIKKLQELFFEATDEESLTRRRRKIKSIARDAEKLLIKNSPDINRNNVYSILFDCYNHLFSMRSSRTNLKKLIEIGDQIKTLPDEYSHIRIKADLLFHSIEMEQGDLSKKQQGRVLAKLIDKYRNTYAESESLIHAAETAFYLGHEKLLKEYKSVLLNKFSNDRSVAHYIGSRIGPTNHRVLFGSRMFDLEGNLCSFPIDFKGSNYIVCFWSEKVQGIKEKLQEVNVLKNTQGKGFRVFSINIDEKDDAGLKFLSEMGLEWQVLNLSGGKESEVYKLYGQALPFSVMAVDSFGYFRSGSIFSNASGTNVLKHSLSEMVQRSKPTRIEKRLSRFFLSGEFLITHPSEKNNRYFPAELKHCYGAVLEPYKNPEILKFIPDDLCWQIQNFFLDINAVDVSSKDSQIEKLKHALKLCENIQNNHKGADNLWLIENRRIVALLSLWSLTHEEQYLKKAIQTSEYMMEEYTNMEKRIVARFCLTMSKLRQIDNPEKGLSVLLDFQENKYSRQASEISLLSSLILSLNTSSTNFYIKSREKLFETLNKKKMPWIAKFILSPEIAHHILDPHFPNLEILDNKNVSSVKLTLVNGEPVSFPAMNLNSFNNLETITKVIHKHSNHCRNCVAKIGALQRYSIALKELGEKEKAKKLNELADAIVEPMNARNRVKIKYVEKIPGFNWKKYRAIKSWSHKKKHLDEYLKRSEDGWQKYRTELAENLLLRADYYARLGRKEDVNKDRLRAEGLIWPREIKELEEASKQHLTYLEIVK